MCSSCMCMGGHDLVSVGSDCICCKFLRSNRKKNDFSC